VALLEGVRALLERHRSLKVYLAVHNLPSTSLGRRRSDDIAKWWFTFTIGGPGRCALGHLGLSRGRFGPFGGTSILESVLGVPQPIKHESWEKAK